MFPVVQVGSLAIQVPGLLLLAGFWVATVVIDRRARDRREFAAALGNLVFFALLAGILGGRLGYATRYISVYLERPLDLLSLQPVAFDSASGAVAAGLTAWAYAHWRRLELWSTLDALAPGLAVLAVSIALAHIASGDAFGAPTDVAWGVELWGDRRHPSQVYELAAAVAGLALVFQLARFESFRGFPFLVWAAWTAGSRLLLEGLRGDSVVAFGSLRAAQLISLAILTFALLAMHFRARQGIRGRRYL
jgi:phosphatidylglycerol---prolipoprotein diacylglyceryl transferase